MQKIRTRTVANSIISGHWTTGNTRFRKHSTPITRKIYAVLRVTGN